MTAPNESIPGAPAAPLGLIPALEAIRTRRGLRALRGREMTGPRFQPDDRSNRERMLAGEHYLAPETIRITRAQYTVARSQLTVQATDTVPTAVLTVSVTNSGEVAGPDDE